MSGRDDVLHDLNDRLNGIMISAELALRLLGQRGQADNGNEVAQILERLRDDCVECTDLVNELRRNRGPGPARESGEA